MGSNRRRKRSEMEEATFSWEVAPHKTDMTFLELEPYQSEGQKQSWKRAVRSQAAKASHHTRRLKEPSFAQHARATKAIPPKKKVLQSNTPRPVQPYQQSFVQSSPFNGIDPSLEAWQSPPSAMGYPQSSNGPSQQIFCLGPSTSSIETLGSNAPAVNPRVHYSEPPCYFSQMPGAFQTPNGSFSTERDSLSPGEKHLPAETELASTTSYDGYQHIPGLMLTPPIETNNIDSQFVLGSTTQSVSEDTAVQSDHQQLLTALRGQRFTSFANTDQALSSAVKLAIESINYNDSTGRNSNALVNAENQAIQDISNALHEPQRASSNQLIAAVAIMAMGSLITGNQSTFYRHSAGLLDMFANKAMGEMGFAIDEGTLSPAGRFERSQSMY